MPVKFVSAGTRLHILWLTIQFDGLPHCRRHDETSSLGWRSWKFTPDSSPTALEYGSRAFCTNPKLIRFCRFNLAISYDTGPSVSCSV